MGLFRVNFWSSDFFGVVLEALRIFLGLDFYPPPPSPIRSSPSNEIRSSPTPPPFPLGRSLYTEDIIRKATRKKAVSSGLRDLVVMEVLQAWSRSFKELPSLSG